MPKNYIFLFLLFAIWPILASAQTGYYYIDSGCEGCRLKPDGRSGRYWLISDEAHPFTMGGGERESELIAADYKAGVAMRYANYAALVGNVTVHRQDSREAAERARLSKITEMREKGYQIVEAPFWFSSHRGIPDVDRYLVYAEKLGFDGVALLAENDWVVHRRGYGWARSEGSLAHNPQIIFPIGEMTQAFTAQAIFLLREAGRLDLSDNLGKIFRNAPADKRSITIKQLLMHTAGFDLDTPPGDYESSSEILDAILGLKLLALPGEKYHFSNAGYELLALIVQKITRQTYDAFLREQILEPFQLKNTGFLHQPPNPGLIADGRTGGRIRPFQPTHTGSYVYLGSHGLLSTAEDLFRWFRTLSKMPFFSEMARYQDGQDRAYGLLVTETGQVISEGRAGAYHAQLTYDRTRHRLIILLSNTDLNAGGAHTAVLTKRINEIMEGKKWPAVATPSIPGAWLAGRYAGSGDTVWIAQSEGRLQLWASGQPLLDLLTAGGPAAAPDGVKEKAEACLAALRTRDWAALTQGFDPAFTDSLRQQIVDLEADLGPLSDVIYRGTIQRPGAGCQSFYECYFAGEKRSYRLDWGGERLAGLFSESASPAIWIGYLLSTSDQELTYLDLFSERGKTLRFAPDGQTVTVVDREMIRVMER